MLENYKINKYGVIEQIVKNQFNYDKAYGDRYAMFSTKNIENLRLGYIIGSLGRVPTSLMDVGYGNGDFLINSSGLIKELYGNDVEPAYTLPDNIKFISNITEQAVEVITFFDSLEHFHDIEFVKDLKAKYVVISLPWCTNGLDDTWFENWKHRKTDEHLFHFNEITLEKFMNSQGFKMINFCNLEDNIRVDKNLNPNILTACFKKI
jgi:hypothetical protein